MSAFPEFQTQSDAIDVPIPIDLAMRYASGEVTPLSRPLDTFPLRLGGHDLGMWDVVAVTGRFGRESAVFVATIVPARGEGSHGWVPRGDNP